MLYLLFLLFLLCPDLVAQHVHDSTALKPSAMIDGSQSPDLIPDSNAYQLVLSNLSEFPNPSEEDAERQRAFLRGIGLSDADIKASIPVLADFKIQSSQLIEEYNASVNLANESGTIPDLASFLRRLDAPVQVTRSELSMALSAAGMNRFDAYVQGEKVHMQIPRTEAIQ